jgi:hypothetical protein
VADLVRDCQNMCNAAGRALANNMGLASGPLIWVNNDRLAQGEELTQMVPWRMFQTVSDPMGGGAPPIGFYQPDTRAQELMAVFERFSVLADEYSGIPRYMTGTEGTPGAGRTASGLSMMINNAGKAIKQVLSNIDVNVLEPMIRLLYYFNMRYGDDVELKGDVHIVARGANHAVAKDAQMVRVNEFLAAVLNSPIAAQVVGNTGIAELLREGAKQLAMDTDKIVPSEDMIRANALAQQNAMMQQQQLAAQGVLPPMGPQGPQGNGQELMNGAPVTDNFQPVGAG